MARPTTVRALLGGQSWWYWNVVELEDQQGVFQDMTTFYGVNWVLGGSWTENVDQPVASGTIQLARYDGDTNISIARDIGGSPVNINALGEFEPFLREGRRFRIKAAITAVGVAAIAGDYVEIMTGTIDLVRTDSDDDQIDLEWRDPGGALLDRQVEVETVYADAMPDSLENTIQAALDDQLGAAVVTLDVPTATGINVQKLKLETKGLLEGLRDWAFLIGWDLRYRYDTDDVMKLTLLQPNRAGNKVKSSDSFTDVSGTLLTAHVGEQAAVWIKHPTVAGDAQITAVGRLRNSANAESLHVIGSISDTPDYSVRATMRRMSITTGTASLLARFDPVDKNGYAFGYNDSTDQWQIRRWDLGVVTTLVSATANPTVGADYDLKATVLGDSLSLAVDGVVVLQVKDATYTLKKRAGIRFGTGNVGTAIGIHLDNFEVSQEEWSFMANEYLAVPRLETAITDVRNAVRVDYTDLATGVRGFATSEDANSIALYDRRFMLLSFATESNINTLAEAQGLADLAVSDLRLPLSDHDLKLAPLFWPIQLYDAIRCEANGVVYDTDQTFGVFGFTQTLGADGGETLLTTKGQVVGGVKEWIRRSRPTYDTFIAPIVVESASQTSTTGTLVITITDPQLRVTLVEFRTRVGDAGAWSAWATDNTVPYGTTVAIVPDETSAIEYRISGISQTGAVAVLVDAVVQFPASRKGYTEVQIVMTSSSPTQVTYQVRAMGGLGDNVGTVTLTTLTGSATLASGAAIGTPVASGSSWTFNRGAPAAADGSAADAQAVWRAAQTGYQTDDDAAVIPPTGVDTRVLTVRARVTATDDTTVTVRVAVADPIAQSGQNVTLTYTSTGVGGVTPSSPQTITSATVTNDIETTGTVDFVITRPAFKAGTGRVTFKASRANRVVDVDAVDVPAQERDTAALGVRIDRVSETATQIVVRVRAIRPVDTGSVSVAYDAGGLVVSPTSPQTLVGVTSSFSTTGFLDFTINKPSSDQRRVAFTVSAAGYVDATDGVDVNQRAIAAGPPSLSLVTKDSAETRTNQTVTMNAAIGLQGGTIQWRKRINDGAYGAFSASATSFAVDIANTRPKFYPQTLHVQVLQDDGQVADKQITIEPTYPDRVDTGADAGKSDFSLGGGFVNKDQDNVSDGPTKGQVAIVTRTLMTQRMPRNIQNLLANPGFEDGNTWWNTNAGLTIVTNAALAHGGNNYAEISGAATISIDQADDNGTDLLFAVVPGAIVQFGGYAMRVSGTGNARFRIRTFDKDGVLVRSVDSGTIALGAWTAKFAEAIVAAGEAFVTARLLATQSVATVTRWDDLYLKIIPPANDMDGILRATVQQYDSVTSRVLAKGHVSGTAIDGAAVTFPIAFQNVPLILISGGIVYEPRNGQWSGGAANTGTMPQYNDTKALNVTATGFTMQARLRQKAAFTARNADADTVNNALTAAGQTAAATLNNAANGSNDNTYAVHYSIVLSATNNGFGIVTSSVTIAIDSSSDGGSTWTQRATYTYSTSSDGGTITDTWSHEIKTIAASGLSSNATADKIRIRVLSLSLADASDSMTAHLFSTAATIPDPTGGLTYNTSAGDSFASRTPDADDTMSWEAIEVS